MNDIMRKKIWPSAIIWIFSSVLSSISTVSSLKEFDVYWNAPTEACAKYGISFQELTNFGIIQNNMGKFRGDKIVILYNPGRFPYQEKKDEPTKINDDEPEINIDDDSHKNTIELHKINGGVPEEGSYTKHEKIFKDNVTKLINESFSGIAVIDFENWKPIFRQNWGQLAPAKNLSESLVMYKHHISDRDLVKKEATINFELHARLFMEETLKLAKKLRPNAKWGYYGYPYCFNLNDNQPSATCSLQVQAENDRIDWLFSKEDILFPSVYLREFLNETQRLGLIRGRVIEAIRLAGKISPKPKVMPYIRFVYTDDTSKFLQKNDMEDGIMEMVKQGADGVIIWGSSNDVRNAVMCTNVKTYVENVLGPAILNIKKIINPPNSATSFANFDIKKFLFLYIPLLGSNLLISLHS